MKPSEIYLTSNLQGQINPDLTSGLLAMLIPLFKQYLDEEPTIRDK